MRADADVPPFGLAAAAAVMHGNNGENILPLYDLLPCAQLQQGGIAFMGTIFRVCMISVGLSWLFLYVFINFVQHHVRGHPALLLSKWIPVSSHIKCRSLAPLSLPLLRRTAEMKFLNYPRARTRIMGQMAITQSKYCPSNFMRRHSGYL